MRLTLLIFSFILFIPIQGISQQLKLSWLNIIDTNGVNQALGMELMDNGNLAVIDYHSAITDVYPGPEDSVFFPTGGTDPAAFVQSISKESGDIEWVGPFGESDFSHAHATSICRDSSDNYYILGHYHFRSDSVDFDPGPDTHMFLHPNATVCYVSKINNSGDLVWFYHTESYEHDGTDWIFHEGSIFKSHDIEYLHEEDVLMLTFSFLDRCDIAPGAEDSLWLDAPEGSFYGTGHITLTTDGLLMAGGYADDFYAAPEILEARNHMLAVDGNSGTYHVHHFSGTIDINPHEEEEFLTSPGIQSIIIQQITESSEITRTEVLGEPNMDLKAMDIYTDKDKNVYLSGIIHCTEASSIDFDIGPETHNLSLAAYETKNFLVKYDSLLNLEWLRTWEGGAAQYYIHAFTVTDYGTILLEVQSDGDFGPFDVDPGPDMVLAESSEEDITNIIALDTAGNFLWYDNISVLNMITVTIQSPNPNTMYLCGFFSGTNWEYPDFVIDFDPHPDFDTPHDSPLFEDFDSHLAAFYVRYDRYCFSDTVDIIEICEGDSVLISGTYRFTSGIYTEHYPTLSGCDSLINYPLSVKPNSESELPLMTICEGDSALIFGNYEFEAGMYHVSLSAVNGCDSTVFQELNVIPFEEASVIISGDSLICEQDAVSYQWIECHFHSEIDGETNQYFTPEFNGYYAVITSFSECQDTSECINFMFSNLENFDNDLFTIYPNPNDGNFEIKLSKEVSNSYEVTIYDSRGNLICEDMYYEGCIRLDLSEYESGIYFVRLTYNDQSMLKKVILLGR